MSGVKGDIDIYQPYRHAPPAQPVRSASLDTLLRHQQCGGAALEELGYRAHVIRHKVFMFTTGTPRNIERTQNPEQLSGLLATHPLQALADN